MNYSVKSVQSAFTFPFPGQQRSTERCIYLSIVKFVYALISCNISQVLARRGKSWVLLQNCARQLYNFSNEVHKRVIALSNGDLLKSQHCFPLNISKIRDLSWPSFYIAADCLLDMLNYSLWNMKEKVDSKSSVSYQSFIDVC